MSNGKKRFTQVQHYLLGEKQRREVNKNANKIIRMEKTKRG